MKNIFKILIVVLVALLFIGCKEEENDNKEITGDEASEFEKAIEKGKLNNFTYTLTTKMIANNRPSNGSSDYFYATDKLFVSNNFNEFKSYLFSYKNKYYDYIGGTFEELSEEEFDKLLNDNVFYNLNVKSFEKGDGVYNFIGSDEEKVNIISSVSDKNYAVEVSNFVCYIKVVNEEVTEFYVSWDSTFNETATFSFEYKLEFRDYGKTVVEIPQSVLDKVSESA